MVSAESVVPNDGLQWNVCLWGEQIEPGALQALESLTLGPVSVYQESDWFADPHILQATIRRLLEKHPGKDLILLRGGLILPRYWDWRLAAALYTDTGMGAISPLNNVHPLMTVGSDTGPAEAERIDRLVYGLGERCNHELPTPWSGCLILSRKALVAAETYREQPVSGKLESEAWLARVLMRAGYCSAVCEHLYVHDPVSPKPVRRSNDHGNVIEPVHPLGPLRHHVRDALQQQLTAPVVWPPRPTQLHIAHSWGGGLGRWIDDMITADDERRNLVLCSVGNWGLYGERLDLCIDYRRHDPLHSQVLRCPIRSTAIAHHQYRTLLGEIIETHGVEAIIVSSLIGHSLDILRTGLPTLHVLHDYHPYCAALNIWFGELCRYCDEERLTACFEHNPNNFYFRTTDIDEWLALQAAYLQAVQNNRVTLIAPTESVRRNWLQLAPVLEQVSLHVVPHGLNWPVPVPGEHWSNAPTGPRLRVVVPGRLTPQKGVALLEQSWPDLASIVELYLLGCGEGGKRFADRDHVHIVPEYDYRNLPAMLSEIRPDLGLLLSTVPETFSYTLSELQAAGIPVLATRLGSFADRIQDGENGFLCAPTVDALIARVKELHEERARLMQVATRLRQTPIRTVTDMLADYHRLLPLDPFSVTAYFKSKTDLQSGFQPRETPVVTIKPDVPFRKVALAFGQYTRQKILHSPRLSRWQKRTLSRILGLMLGTR